MCWLSYDLRSFNKISLNVSPTQCPIKCNCDDAGKICCIQIEVADKFEYFFLLSNLNCILNFHATDLWCISSNYANVGACSIKSINGWKLKSDSFLNFCLESVAIKNRNWLARKVGNNKMDVFMRNFRVSLFWSMKHNLLRIRFYQNDGQEKKKLHSKDEWFIGMKTPKTSERLRFSFEILFVTLLVNELIEECKIKFCSSDFIYGHVLIKNKTKIVKSS